jgi:hypothetical protein
MLTKTLVAALMGATLMTAPALAQNAKPAAPAVSQVQAQNASSMNMWQGSKLIGTNVYDPQNEKIGDIKQLMIDKDGKVDMVVIGVGGFLGMGEHDVAVKWSELKWSEQPVRTSAATTTTAPAGAARPAGTTTGAGATTTTTASNTNPTYPDHAVLNATKDQLKAMPQFNYSK